MKTSKLLNWCALIAGAFLLMGCPYSSTVPLSESGIKITDSLVGTWEMSGESGDKVEVVRTGSNTVDIIKSSATDETSTTYHSHITDVNGTLFLNAREDGEYGSFYFYKMEKEGEFKLTVYPVTEYITETFEDSDALKQFFAANMKNSYFYNSSLETYYKIK